MCNLLTGQVYSNACVMEATICSWVCVERIILFTQDDVSTWKCLFNSLLCGDLLVTAQQFSLNIKEIVKVSYHWPFVWEIYRIIYPRVGIPPVNDGFPKRRVGNACLFVLLLFRLNNLSRNQWSYRWSETPSRPCHIALMNQFFLKGETMCL